MLKKVILLIGVLSLLVLSACTGVLTRNEVKTKFCRSLDYSDWEGVCDSGIGWCDWRCKGGDKGISKIFVENPTYYLILGQAICEEKYKKDFDSFNGVTLTCKPKPKAAEKYDGISISSS